MTYENLTYLMIGVIIGIVAVILTWLLASWAARGIPTETKGIYFNEFD